MESFNCCSFVYELETACCATGTGYFTAFVILSFVTDLKFKCIESIL